MFKFKFQLVIRREAKLDNVRQCMQGSFHQPEIYLLYLFIFLHHYVFVGLRSCVNRHTRDRTKTKWHQLWHFGWMLHNVETLNEIPFCESLQTVSELSEYHPFILLSDQNRRVALDGWTTIKSRKMPAVVLVMLATPLNLLHITGI